MYWLFVFKSSMLKKRVAVHRIKYQSVKKAMNLASQQHKLALIELKQLEAKRASVRRNITRLCGASC